MERTPSKSKSRKNRVEFYLDIGQHTDTNANDYSNEDGENNVPLNDNVLASGDDKTPIRDRDTQLRRKIELTQGPPNKKIGMPIVRSKIDFKEARRLEEKLPKVANGTRNLLGNANGDHLKDDKIPKSLQNLISREKVHPKESATTKNHKIEVARTTSFTGFNLGSNISVQTVSVSKGVTMKRIDAKVPSAPKSNKRTKTSHDTKKNLDSKVISSHNAKLKRKDGPTTSNNNFAPPSKSKKISIVTESKPPHQPHHKTNNTQQNQQNSRHNETTSHHSQSQAVTENGSTSGAGENVLPAVESYRTLEEFLHMPVVSFADQETVIHPAAKDPVPHTTTKVSGQGKEKSKEVEVTASSKPQPHTYYKSKFWELLDPKKKQVPSTTEKSKNYDPIAVKTFMDKQREVRKEQKISESRAQQEQLRRKQKQLKELNEKRMQLLSKTASRSRGNLNNKGKSGTATVDSTSYKLMHKEVENLVNKVVSPSRVESHSSTTAKEPPPTISFPRNLGKLSKLVAQLPIANLEKSPNKASILLQEFETIVKRECINFFQTKKDAYPAHTSTSRLVVRADKAVETTESLAGLNQSRSSCSSISTVKSIPSAIKDYHHAASKIQAAFKGYKERKILKEANILPKDLVQIKKLLHLRPQSQGFVVSKVPEKPYDHEATKHLKQRFGNEQKSTYIPPPSPNASAISVKAETSHLQALPFGKIIRKSFNEPYPKEAIQRIQEAQAEASASRRNSMTDVNILNSSFLNDTKGIRNSLDCSGLRSPGNLDTPKGLKKRRSEGMGLRVPSISAVLFEKLRLLENEKKTTKSVSTTSFSTTSEVGLDKDLESVSSITRGSQKLGDSAPPSQDVTITDDYFGPPDSEVRHTRTSTPLKHQRAQLRDKQTRSKSSSPAESSMSAESATTVETDFELVPSKHEAKPTAEARNNVTSSVPNETTTTSGSTIPIPALKLQYLAEKERLNVLEKALQASTNYEHAIKSKPAMNIPTTSQIVEIAKKVADEQIKQSMAQLEKQKLEALIKQQEQANMGPTNSLQLEMMKCQKEAASATAEISKWMADLGKSLIQDRHRRTNEEPLNLATIVYAAVDEAQRIVQAERRNRQEQRQSLQQIEKAQLVASRKKSRETLMVAQRLLEDVSQQFPSFSEQSLPLVSDNLQEETDNSTVVYEYEQQHCHVISEQDESEPNIDSSINASDSNVIRSLLEHAKSFVDEVIDGRSKFSEREGTESIAYDASFLSDVKDKTESVISEPDEKQLGQGLSFADRTESIIPEVSDVTGGKTDSIISEEKFPESVSEVECEVGTNLSGDISEPKSESFLSEDQDQKEKSLHLKEEKHAPILTQTSLDKPLSFIEPELASIKEQSKIGKSEDVSDNDNTSFVALEANRNHDELQFDESLKINEETDLLKDKLESTVPVLEHKEMKEDQQESLGSPHVKPLENVKKLDDVVSVVEPVNDQDFEEKLDISSEILPPGKGPDEDNETSKENLNASKVQPIVETIQPLLVKETIPISKGGIAEKSHSSENDPNTESVSYEVEIEPDISNASSNNVALLDKSIALDQDEDQAKQTVESGMVAQDEMKSVADKTLDENYSAEIKPTKEMELSSVEDKPFVVVRAPAEMKFASDLKEMEVIKASEVSSELNRAKDEMLTLEDEKIKSTSNEKEVAVPEEIQIAKISPEIVNLVAESVIASPIQKRDVDVSPTIEAKQIVDIGESCAAQSPEGKEKSEINYSKTSEEPAIVGIAASPAIVIDGDLSAPKEKQIEDTDKSKFPEGNQNIEIVMSNESESESATAAKNYEPEKVSERIQTEQLVKDQLSLQLKPVVASFQNQVGSILSQIENDTHSILSKVNEESSELKLLDISSQLNESQEEEPITPSVKVSAELEALDADSRQEVVGISSQPLSVSASSDKSEQALSDVDKEHDTSEKYSESFLSDFEKEEDFEGDQMSEGLNDTEQEISYLVDSDNEQLEESFECNNVLLDVTSEERLESHHEEEDIEEKTELLEIAEQQQRVEDEIRELKSKISSPIEDYLSALEEQGQEIRPPPPYSSPSLDFLLYSMQFSDSALTKDMILQAIHSYADEMWDAWESTGKLIQNSSSSVEPEDLSTTEVPDEDDEEENSILYLKYAEQCSQTFVNTAVREGIEQALYIKELDTDIGFVDTLRKGQFAVHALRHKRPKSKSDLVKAVYNQIIKFFPDLQEPKAASSEGMKAEKWCCKPRDKVENHLVSDMLDYEPQWLDVWPETLLIADDAAEMIAVESLQEVIANFEIAMNHE